jgi:hypothetical protein
MDTPGYPLYPGSDSPPRDGIARLYGPAASVDGHDVSTLGDAFELLPGCHAVLTRGRPIDATNSFSATASQPLGSTNFVFAPGGQPRGEYFVLPMRPGDAYVIKQVSSADVSTIATVSVSTFVEEFDHGGVSQRIFHPAEAHALDACKEGGAAERRPARSMNDR